MMVMCWCVMPEVFLCSPCIGLLELFSRLRLTEPDPVHLELRRLPFELLQGALDNQYLLADLSTHKPFTSIH